MPTIFWSRVTVLLFLIISLASLCVLPVLLSSIDNKQYLEIHFLAVGQGDAVFIETPDGVQVLVDAGRDKKVLAELGQYMEIYDRAIDMVVMTHPDSDHIGGMDDVLSRFSVEYVLTTEVSGAKQITSRIAEAMAVQTGLKKYYARAGMKFALGASTTLSVLSPKYNPTSMERNASSIVLQLKYGDTSVLLTGDAPKAIEKYLVLGYGESLESEVLKVGHHGSRTSTSQLFLETVDPEKAIISAGQNNSYGHPHIEVTDLLLNAGIDIYSTAIQGTITLEGDGHQVWVE